MTSKHLKMEVVPTSSTSCVSNIPEAMDNSQYNICIMNPPLSQTVNNIIGNMPRHISPPFSKRCGGIRFKAYAYAQTWIKCPA